MQTQDLNGTRFGMLRVVKAMPKLKGVPRSYLCLCDCGRKTVWQAGSIRLQIRKGINSSCGCNRGKARRTHGMRKSAEYNTWAAIVQRCTNPNETFYFNYGGRGITLCERWRKFENFYADMGPRPEGTSIERINNDGNYEPDNCRWATRIEQARNQRSNRLLTANGVIQTVAAWAEKLGISESSLRSRLKRGWPEEVACTYPKAKHWSRQPSAYAAAGFPIGVQGPAPEMQQMNLNFGD